MNCNPAITVAGRAKVGHSATEPILAVRFDSLGLAAVIDPQSRVFVKIDTEGCELRVLRGMQNFLGTHNVERVVAEVNDVLLDRLGGSRAELYRLMKQEGFMDPVAATLDDFDEVFIRKRP